MSTIGLAFMAIYALLFILYGILRIKMVKGFSEYSKNVSLPEEKAIFIQLSFFYCGIITGSGLFFGYSFRYINCLCCIFPTFLLILVTFIKVYCKGIDTVRTQVNLASILLNQLVYVYFSIDSNP